MSLRKPVAVLSLLLVSACASTLLWTRAHQDDPRSFASTLAVDAAGATYVGGGVLELPVEGEEDVFWKTPTALLSKYDSNGQRLWTQKIAESGSIKRIHVLEGGRLLVHARSPVGSNEQADAMWIVSSETGELLTQFDAFSPERPFADIDVQAGKIYIATAHSLAVYDQDGNLQDSQEVAETIADIDVAENGDVLLKVAPEDFSSAYQKRSAELDWQWQTPTINYALDPSTFTALPDGALAVYTNGTLTKYDALGNVVFSSLLRELTIESDLFYSSPYYLGPAQIRADQSGDLYFATTITDFYVLSAVDDYPFRANIATSTTLAKLSGTTGAVLWKDNLRTNPSYGPIDTEQRTQVFSNTFYWPISLAVTDQGIKMVMNAFRGDYLSPVYGNRTDGCMARFDDFLYPGINCPLTHLTETYSREYTYDAVSGKRLKRGEKIKGNVRSVAYSATGQLHVVGDHANEMNLFQYAPMNLGSLVFAEFVEDAPLQKFLPGGAAYSPQSQLFVSKYK